MHGSEQVTWDWIYLSFRGSPIGLSALFNWSLQKPEGDRKVHVSTGIYDEGAG